MRQGLRAFLDLVIRGYTGLIQQLEPGLSRRQSMRYDAVLSSAVRGITRQEYQSLDSFTFWLDDEGYGNIRRERRGRGTTTCMQNGSHLLRRHDALHNAFVGGFVRALQMASQGDGGHRDCSYKG